MSVTLISALIALSGVIISVIITYLSNKKVLKTELEKLETTIEQNYATKLVEKRLEFYPIVYAPLSDLAKKIRRLSSENKGEKIILKDLIDFQAKYDELNSKYGVVFSSVSSGHSKNLRVFLSEVISKSNLQNNDVTIDFEDLQKLKNAIGELEFSLKQDIGIYIVEFNDPKRNLKLKKYEDVVKQRENLISK